MDGQESARFIKKAITLIEVMVALIIFSSMIGMASDYVSSALTRPFVTDRAESWLVFMDQVNQTLQELPLESPLIGNSIHSNPFPDIDKPGSLKTWQLKWVENNLNNYATAQFTATTHQNRSIEWTVHKKIQ